MQKPIEVSAFERLYAPLDMSGNRLKTINERLHRSVAERYGKSAPVCVTDSTGECEPTIYQPRNLASVFPSGALGPDIAVAD